MLVCKNKKLNAFLKLPFGDENDPISPSALFIVQFLRWAPMIPINVIFDPLFEFHCRPFKLWDRDRFKAEVKASLYNVLRQLIGLQVTQNKALKPKPFFDQTTPFVHWFDHWLFVEQHAF